MALLVTNFHFTLDVAGPNPNEELTLTITNGEGEQPDPANLPPGHRDALLAWAAYPEEP